MTVDRPTFHGQGQDNRRDQGVPTPADLHGGPVRRFYTTLAEEYRANGYTWDSSQGKALRDFSTLTGVSDGMLMMFTGMLIEAQEKDDSQYAAASAKIKRLAVDCLTDTARATALAIRVDELVTELWPQQAAEAAAKRRPLTRPPWL